MLGANTGIGFELVRLLAEKTHTVYIGARNEIAGKEAQCVSNFG
jgi:NAD(P)-dependent dehydrogenase (short-subunit alcohol dehydrogenase family)